MLNRCFNCERPSGNSEYCESCRAWLESGSSNESIAPAPSDNSDDNNNSKLTKPTTFAEYGKFARTYEQIVAQCYELIQTHPLWDIESAWQYCQEHFNCDRVQFKIAICKYIDIVGDFQK